MLDLSLKNLAIVRAILAAYIPQCEVRIFGSRVTQKAKKYSDLDLVIIGKKAIDEKILYKIKDELAESDLPIRVDVLDWHKTSKDFQNIINEKYEVIQQCVE